MQSSGYVEFKARYAKKRGASGYGNFRISFLPMTESVDVTGLSYPRLIDFSGRFSPFSLHHEILTHNTQQRESPFRERWVGDLEITILICSGLA